MTSIIGITIGDPAGIGPEVTLRAVAGMSSADRANTRIFGNLATLAAAQAAIGTALDLVRDVTVTDLPVAGGPRPFGKIDTRAAAAVRAAEAGQIGCIVTAPINKAALNAAGHRCDGHTGMPAALTGQKDAFTLLASEPMKVIHVSTHVSLKDAIARATPDRIPATIRAGNDNLKRSGIASPRIAVAGINPHCGENSLFGRADDQMIAPGVAMAQAEGINVSGPISADTLFHRACNGAFDLVVAQYHDQGHIPIKLVAFDTAVNVSVGLAIDRAPVEHGTAFAIAGKGIANHVNLNAAIAYARKLAAGRNS